MFDIGWGELVVIGVVALIAIGPKELPGALRTLGHWMGQVRRMASEFQNQFNEAMREAEMADLKKQVDNLTSGFDPIDTMRKEIEGAAEDKPSALATPSAETLGAGSGDTPSANAPGGDVPSAYVPHAPAPDAGFNPADLQVPPPEPPPAAETENALAGDAPGSAKPGDRAA